MKRFGILLLVVLTSVSLFSKESLMTYPAPQGAALNDDFTVRVRQKGGEWRALSTYLVKVDEVKNTKHHIENASMATFDFSGTVEVAVTYNKRKVNTARIRPLSHNISSQIEDQTVVFSLSRPCNLSVEVDGDIFHNLHLFANPSEESVPDKNDPDVLYYAQIGRAHV